MGVPRWFILLAGPNGAGKSTFASRFLPSLFEDVPFINVDELAGAMVPTAPNPDFAAGREAIRRIESLVDQTRQKGVKKGVILLYFMIFPVNSVVCVRPSRLPSR